MCIKTNNKVPVYAMHFFGVKPKLFCHGPQVCEQLSCSLKQVSESTSQSGDVWGNHVKSHMHITAGCSWKFSCTNNFYNKWLTLFHHAGAKPTTFRVRRNVCVFTSLDVPSLNTYDNLGQNTYISKQQYKSSSFPIWQPGLAWKLQQIHTLIHAQ